MELERAFLPEGITSGKVPSVWRESEGCSLGQGSGVAMTRSLDFILSGLGSH